MHDIILSPPNTWDTYLRDNWGYINIENQKIGCKITHTMYMSVHTQTHTHSKFVNVPPSHN